MLPYQPNPIGKIKPLETEYKHLIITEGSADWGMPREIAAYEVISETVGQCTGLKDKNGKLIYEGDIVNVKIDGRKISYIPMVVVWDRKEWQLKQYNKNYKQNCSACEVKRKQKCQYCSQYFSATAHTNFKDFYNNEVIGNIYENSELLEVENETELRA